MQSPNDKGFSLVEVLIALGIFTTALVTLAGLGLVAARTNASARSTTTASLLAAEKLEQLRALVFSFDAAGLPITDAGLSASPSGALSANTNGCVDYLDEAGAIVASGIAAAPPGASYTRRWSVVPLPSNPANTLVLQVLVTRFRNRGSADVVAGGRRLPDEARFVAIRTRKGLS